MKEFSLNNALDMGEKKCFIKKNCIHHWIFDHIQEQDFKVKNNSKWQVLQISTKGVNKEALSGKLEQTKFLVLGENEKSFPVVI